MDGPCHLGPRRKLVAIDLSRDTRVIRIHPDGSDDVLLHAGMFCLSAPRVAPDGTTLAVVTLECPESFWWVPAGRPNHGQ